ncbi:MAG: helix-turn-helix domain-containing protein [Candidatus Methanodesulfokora sp.]
MEDLLNRLGLNKAEKKIIVALSSSDRPLSIAEISRASNIPIKTVYKIIKPLADRGFVKSAGGRPARYTAKSLIEMVFMEIQEKIDDIIRVWSVFSEISDSPLLVDLMRDCLPDAIKISGKSVPVVLEWILSRGSDLRILIPTRISFPCRNLVDRIKRGKKAIILVDLDNKLVDELKEKNLVIRKVRNKSIFGVCNGKEAIFGVEEGEPSYLYLRNELSMLFDPLFESFLRRSIPTKMEGSV